MALSTDEQARQHAVDDLVVTDDHLTDLGLHTEIISTELVTQSFDVRVDRCLR